MAEGLILEKLIVAFSIQERSGTQGYQHIHGVKTFSLLRQKNLGGAYNTDTVDYEAGLLLDADTGTLDYYHKGMFVNRLTDSLAGGYVWVMQLKCKGSERHSAIKTSTY